MIERSKSARAGSTAGAAAFALALCLLVPVTAAAQSPESLWYLVQTEESVQGFLAHADRVSIIAPQTYLVDENGILWGSVDERVLRTAREHGVKVMPLVRQPGFDQPTLQKMLRSPEATQRAIDNIARLCKEQGYWGIQFDFENIHISDREAFTAFYKRTGEALHANGCKLSAAVVSRTGDIPGSGPFQHWIYEYWRSAYDYKAMADASDFLSLMTYDQHTRRTPPGPVAGIPWVEKVLAYVQSLGVPPEKISLGIPDYSDFWYATYDLASGGHVTGNQLPYKAALGLLAQHDAKPAWDAEQKVNWARWENEGLFEYLFFEDFDSFRSKLALVPKHHLRGFSVWVIGSEDPRVWDLVAAPRRAAG